MTARWTRRRERPIRPLRTALGLSLAYLALCSVYIVLSSAWAARIAESVIELQRFEQWKGLVFVAVTGVLFFALAWLVLARLAREHELLARQRALLQAAEGPVLAGSFSAAIAHDMNNVLAVAKAGLHGLSEVREGESPERATSMLRRALDDLSQISRRMSRLGAQHDAPVRRVDDLADTVRETVAFARRHPTIGGCRVELDCPPRLVAEIDRSLIQRALLNLLLNAAEATGGRGRIRVRLGHDAGDFRLAVIEVEDDGPGVDASRRDEIFTAFHTTQTGGTGLGLLSVLSAAQTHEGEALVTGSDLGGARFRIRLRISPAAEPPREGDDVQGRTRDPAPRP